MERDRAIDSDSSTDPVWSDWLAALVLLASCAALAITQVLAH